MLFESVKVGDRLEISKKEMNPNSRAHASRVEKILGDNQVLIQVPTFHGKPIKLPQEANYNVIFFTDKGMVSFDAAILDYLVEDRFNLIHIKLVSKGERIQRREFYRFDCLLTFRFYSAGEDDSMDSIMEEIANSSEGLIKDLGGGGIRFVANVMMDEGSYVGCIIYLDAEMIICIGKVLHRQYFPKAEQKFQYRLQFQGITPLEQEKIVQYIFNQQRKKGMKPRS